MEKPVGRATGVTKASGVAPTLVDLGIPPEQTVAVGDAENDHAFMRLCGMAVAVANALPSVKADADWITPGARGEGVTELIDRLLANDLADITPRRDNKSKPSGEPLTPT